MTFPGTTKNIWYFLIDNWGYLVALFPFAFIFYFWLKKGRDKKFVGDNVYYKPNDEKTDSKPLFARAHLPMVYHPIQSLSPAQVGTIIDEKVDIHDIVAEIVELARLKYLKIEKFESQGGGKEGCATFSKQNIDFYPFTFSLKP